ncbi:MAG: hypothetical protein A3C93_02020 [Candidatus Lloydbacteria bacterium RIFCSPHIGHO2_02_FULL_54_17]|uniref:PEP-utilising enzyme mobile domain-containing protein n=1 Tax=Candidatus Lloydbacteria bacterium RIFCSPHIGHO2_02_FULL_54_17 TaxID=1798664 RepID=A0A1G2DK87_9BACT|nr:MAG: hypothetical protein A2762_05570 [Candidatus Lloydbacteria bacterium RIFCSPHIGHO2_01_FULL_54_11]OGZ13228.1 MAG: hypothetical protein A3C93_02020 [Candidatus Lloydbacteria bacterium RIFCSPHIGHO2_02_FULL_54_17]OGZ14887.1 MAG: hypothetical protein A3H76_02625 [Candidatus Lloydbacteria bacterium RIFCSPLOWO2_02_FULL_54_12]OGZ15358.1 MAG: hypothetical protein A2948_00035 [Candidatus Lloydbacteria bacterium RIFCSPLOWO2_01_FULL_54_18]
MTTYDNSNLAESYSGATTPLTYSFAREVYAGVYPHFLGMMGVSRRLVEANADLFPNMLAFIGNNMYYNLTEWYRMLALLPAYEVNKKFFDRMLGVKEGSAATLFVRNDDALSWISSLKGRFRLLFQITAIVLNFLAMGFLVKRFNRRFDMIFREAKAGLPQTKTYDELVGLFQRTEKSLLALWRTPVANDFAVMVSTGALASRLAKNGETGALPELLRSRSRGPLWSLDPGQALARLALHMGGEEKIVKALRSGDVRSTLQMIDGEFPQIHSELESYIDTYGARSPHELKLESATLSERPEMLIPILAQLVERSGAGGIGGLGEGTMHRGRHGLFSELLAAWSRISIARREETRFRRSLIFGFARTIVLALGGMLVEHKVIGSAGDVFFLRTEELLRPFGEMKKQEGVRELIKTRRESFAYWQMRTLPQRFETDDKVEEIERLLRETTQPVQRRSPSLRGTPACFGGGGVFEGKALVLRSFDPDAPFIDRVLITKHTDPGWTIVFPLLRAIVVERGGMLSHAAIVARELDIPCIVGVPDAVAEFQTGEIVSVDIENGVIAHHDYA